MWIAALVGACLFVVLVWAAFSVPEWRGSTARASRRHAARTDRDADRHGPARRACRWRPIAPTASGYLLMFEIISVHLLVVLIGAAYLARAKRKRSVLVE